MENQDHEALSITLEENSHGGRYVATLAGFANKAEMNFRRRGDDQIIVSHTGVPEEMEGRGIGTALVRHAVMDARARGFTIIAHCSFVRAQARKHPEWSDVIAG